MSTVGKREYSSELRTDQARRTRKQIVDAAGTLFAEQGFASTTVDAIAAAAGVSRKTVFTSIPGGKVAVLKLAYDYAVAGDDEPVAMVDRPGIQGLIREPDPAKRLADYAVIIAGMGDRVSRLYLALRGAAEVDGEAQALYSRWEEDRRTSMLNGPVQLMVAEGSLTTALSPQEAADILAVLVNPATYHQLVVVCGWPEDRFVGWLARTLQDQLLIEPPKRGTIAFDT